MKSTKLIMIFQDIPYILSQLHIFNQK